MKASRKRPKILIAFPSSKNSRTEKMRGIYRYLADKGRDWEFVIMHEYMKVSRDYLKRLVGEGLNGAIFTAVDVPVDAVSFMADIHLPVVTIALDMPRRDNISFVLSDNSAQGQLAAREFIKSDRFRSFAYVPLAEPTDWCRLHERGFRATASELGFDVSVFASPPEKDRSKMIRWIRELPKPAAIFAACDYRANDVLLAAHKAKVGVPDEVEVMGMDNDTILCENTRPRLTSIQPDFERQGYLAAKLLDRLISGQRETVSVSVAPREIVWRESAVPSRRHGGILVQRAIAFINREYAAGIGVRDVVDYLKVSRPLVDLRFRQFHGQSVLSTITEIRLAKTRELLISAPHLSIAEVCRQSGWQSERYPKRLFLRRFGTTMRDARRMAGQPPQARTP